MTKKINIFIHYFIYYNWKFIYIQYYHELCHNTKWFSSAVVKALVIQSGDCEFNSGTDMRKIFQYFSYYKLLNWITIYSVMETKNRISLKNMVLDAIQRLTMSLHTQYTRELYGIFTHKYNWIISICRHIIAVKNWWIIIYSHTG